YQCRDAKDDSQAHALKANYFIIQRGGWKEREERDGRVLGAMSQDRHQHAATTVIQDPSNDDRKAYFTDYEQGESNTDADEASIGVGAGNGPKEEGEVPHAPERPKDEGSDQGAV